jgi:hypothetical protein
MNLPFDESDHELLAPLPDDVTNYNHPLWWSYNWNTLFVIRTDVFERLWDQVERCDPRSAMIQHLIPTYSDYTLVFATYKNDTDRRLTQMSDFVFSFGSYGLGMNEFRVIKSRDPIFSRAVLCPEDRGPLPQQLQFLEKFNEWTAPQNVINNTYDGPNPSNRIS